MMRKLLQGVLGTWAQETTKKHHLKIKTFFLKTKIQEKNIKYMREDEIAHFYSKSILYPYPLS